MIRKIRGSALLVLFGAATSMGACGSRTDLGFDYTVDDGIDGFDDGFDGGFDDGVGASPGPTGGRGPVPAGSPSVGGSGGSPTMRPGGRPGKGGSTMMGRAGRGGRPGVAGSGGSVAGATGTGGRPWAGGGGVFPIPMGGRAGGTGSGWSCCSAHDSPGCISPVVESCVCQLDPYCCTIAWDEACVHEVDMWGCGACTTGGAGGVAGGAGMGVGGSTGLATLICQQADGDRCVSCLCSSCFSQFDACVRDVGCLLVADCLGKPDTSFCKEVLERFGDPMGPAMSTYFDLIRCSELAACGCS